jgi:hypothetical protein
VAVLGVAVIASLLAAGGGAATPPNLGAGVPFHVATRVPRPGPTGAGAEPQRRPSVTMSEGWACAVFGSEQGPIRQCWDAGPSPRAFPAPWMKDRITVARDRWCEHDVGGLTFRCWHRPRRGDTGPRELPARWQWLNPHGASWNDVYNRSDRLEDVTMGGTFACLRTTQAQGVFCLGDDRFGQLGQSAPPGPKAGRGGPPFVRDVGREVRPALGTWHACGLAPPRGMEDPFPVVCWGRGDHGQLGAPAPDKCTVDGQAVACARTPVRGPLVRDQMAVLGAGDLFTCVTAGDGTRCWGASRDGLFGARGSCPEGLRRAWPTPDGPVPAPNASCTAAPVRLPGGTMFDPHFQVAPRRICYVGAPGDGCLSGVPKPRDPKIVNPRVSPGSDASACAASGEGVVCWGETYSPPGAPDQPVPVVFEPLPSLGDMAVVDGAADAAAGKERCQRERPCQEPVRKLPACEGDNDPGRPVAEILAKAKKLSGGIVRVRGALGVRALGPSPFRGGIHYKRKACDSTVACCQSLWAPVLVGDQNGALVIDGLYCSGDESRACCNAPAYGQPVIASGVLVREPREYTTVGWRMVNVSVCEVPYGQQ